MKMKLLAAAVIAAAAFFSGAQAAEPLEGHGDVRRWAATPAVRAWRTNGDYAFGEAFGIKIIEQYSAWQPEKMLEQFGRRSRQSRVHRDHGPPGQQRLRAAGQAGTRRSSDHRRQLPTYQNPEDVRLAGHRLRRRRSVHRRLDHGLEDAGGGQKAGDKALVYGLLGGGRAQPIGQGHQRHAGKGRRQGRLHRDFS